MKFAAVAVLASLLTIGISADNSCKKMPCPPGPKVCASNGVTYMNRCEFDYQNCENGNYRWKVGHEGMCRRGGTRR
ncbi:hypothetical protein PR003_g20200 [Phytophthora rubi]|uniref:Kazal-like domain-containing protein n=1 Tax=Phytophthora rubi TaxID=129364 RepID=A0A6A4DYS0_9STRA|nr:hypothetical protein PR002_g22911 [Phytophthora rubi]KAE8999503.1 hypothetical protein PR001_g19038 [Phytophthora rubi]KAE9310708.1 hypothetical protein PR003_g20200 [Phytophthora rubi]